MRIPVAPLAKPRMTQRDRWARRPSVEAYWDYCDELRRQLPGFVVPSRVALRFEVPMPASWSKQKRARHVGRPHEARPDIDNLIKGIFDALCENDSYIHGVIAEKYWADTGAIELCEW